jgi:sugar fermentation stimulation protein A
MLHRQPLLPARVVDQPNRFTVRVQLDGASSNEPVGAYLANTGNLRSILVPGAELRVTPAPRPGGKLPYHLVLARQWNRWVAVDANLSAHLFAEAIDERRLPGFRGWRLDRREPPVDGGRLDLLLSPRRGAASQAKQSDHRRYVEVKCTTLVRNGVARFPNPATARGTRHLHTLIDLVREGHEAAICFVAQRSDARAFQTLPDVDPDFAATLAEARAAGVLCHAYRARVTQTAVWLHEQIPILD